MPQPSKTRPGNIEYNTITSEIKKVSGSDNKWNVYRKCTFPERYKIGKYAAEHGNDHFKLNNLKGSTARLFNS